jgi:hypothetical protein
MKNSDGEEADLGDWCWFIVTLLIVTTMCASCLMNQYDPAPKATQQVEGN